MELSLFRKYSKKPDDAPGTIVYVDDAKDVKINLNLINYDTDTLTEQEVSLNELSFIEEKSGIKWFNITGIHDLELIQKIGDQFSIHNLVLEDIANTAQQLKIENYSESLFCCFENILPSNKTNKVMKTLTLVSTISVPITVITGINGMDFQYMPEISSPIAYPVVLASMTGVGISLYRYLEEKNGFE